MDNESKVVFQLDGSGPNLAVYSHFDNLRGELSAPPAFDRPDEDPEEISRILQENAAMKDIVRDLQQQLSLYKAVMPTLQGDCYRLEKEKAAIEQQRADLELKLKEHRVVVLIDGDGAIFKPEILNQGAQGGYLAAQRLSRSVLQYLNTRHGPNSYQLYVNIFLNKKGLIDTLGRAGPQFAKVKVDDFIIGFNKAAERFIMVDVGSAKEAADAKIKAFLEDDIKLPQTEKIVFGGCHDNGYVTTLRSHITAGFKDKLVLLPSYVDVAAGIAELDLPCVHIPELFIPHKLNIWAPPLPLSANSSPLIPAAGNPKGDNAIYDHPKSTDFLEQTLDALPFASVIGESDGDGLVTQPLCLSYSSVLRTPAKRCATPDIDSAGSTSASNGSDDGSPSPKLRPAPTSIKARRINPNIPLSKQTPPPCTLFYLSTCKHGACKYGHDYELNDEQYAEIRRNAKKAPCPARNKGEKCLWGEECCYGHSCSLGSKCHFLKKGQCKFVGGDMHRERGTETG